ncbi:MAG: SPOR domain-containing protein [Candidatus Latescibacteria bacterium]|nr:SPOR domain-containing protein [Candidatus Latescibacterota bacterium]
MSCAVRLSLPFVSCISLLLLGCGIKSSPQPISPQPVTQVDAIYAPVLPDPRSDMPPMDRRPQTSPPKATGYSSPVMSGEGVSVFSVQILASSSSAPANRAAAEVRQTSAEPVDVVQATGGVWKVYVGRFARRADAQTSKTALETQYPGAWITRRQTGATSPTRTGRYSVQIYAGSTARAAQAVADQVRREMSVAAEVIDVSGTFKVLVGRENDRAAINRTRDSLRNKGFPDAWVYDRGE